MTDRELTGDEAQRALSEAVRRTRATSAALVPAETVRSKQIADALKLLQRVTAECDGAPTDHAWRTCKHCTAIHGIEMRFGLTMRLLNAAIEALASSAVQPEPPTTQAVSPQDLQVGGDHASSSDLAAAKAPRSHKRMMQTCPTCERRSIPRLVFIYGLSKAIKVCRFCRHEW